MADASVIFCIIREKVKEYFTMKKPVVFQGAATALVTPLTAEGVDYPKMRELLEWQIAEGINALVICGTSGEGSTLSDEEH